MEENNDKKEEQAEIAISPEKSPEEVVAPGEQAITIPNKETENMEIHQHAHAHGKKNWKSYLWEFLMLFLAVFCGFLAEYQLEHKIERERGEQYVHSFYEDLVSDTAKFSLIINDYKMKNNALSGMFDCYDAITKQVKSSNCLEKLYLNSRGFNDLAYTDRTMQQLKNAGGLRLLKASDADSILEYDNLIREYLKVETTSLQEIQNTIRNSLYSMVNFRKVTDTTKNYNTPFLYKSDPGIINSYFNQIFIYYQSTEKREYELKNIRSKAVSLIRYFKNKYGLK
jgi:hypothetical protein